MPERSGIRRGILRPVSGNSTRRIRALAAAVLGFLLLVPSAEMVAAKKTSKKRKAASASAPKTKTSGKEAAVPQGPALPVYQGPPAPPLLRAAGVCMQFEPGVFIVLAEVGGSGRVFRLDASTNLEVKPQRGGRLRILYVDGADGPLARKVMQGPIETLPPGAPAPSDS